MISSYIFPEDERSETVCKSIIDTLHEKGQLLDQWIAIHESMFGTDHDIPSAHAIHLSKLNHGVINTDTCNAARLLNSMICDAVDTAVREKIELEGGNSDDACVLVLQQDCHHHLRNVWIRAVVKHLSTDINKIMASDLSEIDYRYHVTTMFDAILRAVDKEFSLPDNYPKGHGMMLLHWLKLNHPGALLLPIVRTAGSCQDLACEGGAAFYWNRRYDGNQYTFIYTQSSYFLYSKILYRIFR